MEKMTARGGNRFATLRQIRQPTPVLHGERVEGEKARKELPGAFLLGSVSGLVSFQFTTPVLAAILTYVMAQKTGLTYGAILLFIYALVWGVLILLAGTFIGVLKGFRNLGRWSEIMEKASGVIILLVGIYFLWIV